MPFDSSTQNPALAAFIERFRGVREDQFDMERSCGTACCIGGWAAVWGGDGMFVAHDFSVATNVPYDDAMAICYPGYGRGYAWHPGWRATHAQAMEALELYAAGRPASEVWDRVMGVL